MKTFIYSETNGSANIVFSANNQEEADEYMKELVKDTDEWIFQDVVEEYNNEDFNK